jgi:hypothetical protein
MPPRAAHDGGEVSIISEVPGEYSKDSAFRKAVQPGSIARYARERICGLALGRVRCTRHSKHVDERPQRWRNLTTARMVEGEPFDRRRPAFENPDKLPGAQEGFDNRLDRISDPHAVKRRTNEQLGSVDRPGTTGRNSLSSAVALERPFHHVAIFEAAILDAMATSPLAGWCGCGRHGAGPSHLEPRAIRPRLEASLQRPYRSGRSPTGIFRYFLDISSNLPFCFCRNRKVLR